MIIEPAILAERARLLREAQDRPAAPTERELWVAHREKVKIGRAYVTIAIIILSLGLWAGIWFAVAAVNAWISPWL